MPNDKSVSEQVSRLSLDAFNLAKDTATGRSDPADLKTRAKAMDERLTILIPEIRGMVTPDQSAVMQAWTDARLDLTYVLAGGGPIPTSTRLGFFLQDLQKK